FKENLVFFYSPSDIATKPPAKEQTIRLGGLVEKDSIKRSDGQFIRFKVTDGTTQFSVEYTGMLPALFREEQGVVAEGTVNESGVLVAKRILTKHDEKYMPKEVVEALKQSGRWQEGQETP